MKAKKLTKRQILNELLVIEEKKAKVDASQERLWKREEKLSNRRNDLRLQLESICLNEQKKAGDTSYQIKEPIVYKGHVFTLAPEGRSYATNDLSIKPIKVVK